MHHFVNMKQSEQQAEQLLRALMDYSVQHGAPLCYQNWTPETLNDYFCFHARQGTLTWVQRFNKVEGTAVAWQVDERVLRHGDITGGYRFDWNLQDNQGDSVFFADVVASSPQAVICLMASFGQRFPHWAKLKWFTYRRGQLVQLKQRHLKLFLRKTKNYVERQSA